MKKSHASVVVIVAGAAASCMGQVIQEPIGAILRYQVAMNGGAWGSSVVIVPGERVEWRAVLTFTGTANAAALGRIFYQPVLTGVDNIGTSEQVDRLGEWRNGGASGQGNTTLAQGLLSQAEGNNSNALASYGRVAYGATEMSASSASGPLTEFRHSNGSSGAPPGDHIRIAGANNQNWYPASQPNGSVEGDNAIRWGVASDNSLATRTWFQSGTQSVVVFRQAYIASPGNWWERENTVVAINSEAATLQRAGGSTGTDDTRFMTWALPGEGGSTATVHCGVQYIGATINFFIPSPGAIGLVGLGCAMVLRRRERR